MKTIINRILVSLIALALTPFFTQAKETMIRIDLRTGAIGSVAQSDSLDQIKSKLGKNNVTQFIFESEGEKEKAHRLKFNNGEEVVLYPQIASIKTRGFRTEKDLGVGSTWNEFKKEFTDGDLEWFPEAYAVWSEKFKFRLYFEISGPPALKTRVNRIEMNR